MIMRLDERLSRPAFSPYGDKRAPYETHGTSFLVYLARRTAKTRTLLPLRALLARERAGGPEFAGALVCFGYFAVAASTTYGRGYRQPDFDGATEAHERDRETGARIGVADIGVGREIRAEIRATLPQVGTVVSREHILGTQVRFSGLGMPAPTTVRFEVDGSGRAAGLTEWRAEATGTVTTELALRLGGPRVRAYGSLQLRSSDGSSGTARFDREGSLTIEVTDPRRDVLRLIAPLA